MTLLVGNSRVAAAAAPVTSRARRWRNHETMTCRRRGGSRWNRKENGDRRSEAERKFWNWNLYICNLRQACGTSLRFSRKKTVSVAEHTQKQYQRGVYYRRALRTSFRSLLCLLLLSCFSFYFRFILIPFLQLYQTHRQLRVVWRAKNTSGSSYKHIFRAFLCSVME